MSVCQVLMKGVEASRPSQGNLVTVKVTGRLETGGCVYDKTERFILGDGDVIAGVALLSVWDCLLCVYSVCVCDVGGGGHVFVCVMWGVGDMCLCVCVCVCVCV